MVSGRPGSVVELPTGAGAGAGAGAGGDQVTPALVLVLWPVLVSMVLICEGVDWLSGPARAHIVLN